MTNRHAEQMEIDGNMKVDAEHLGKKKNPCLLNRNILDLDCINQKLLHHYYSSYYFLVIVVIGDLFLANSVPSLNPHPVSGLYLISFIRGLLCLGLHSHQIWCCVERQQGSKVGGVA